MCTPEVEIQVSAQLRKGGGGGLVREPIATKWTVLENKLRNKHTTPGRSVYERVMNYMLVFAMCATL